MPLLVHNNAKKEKVTFELGRQIGYSLPRSRGVAQSGSASGLGPEGPEFESRRPDQPLLIHLYDSFDAFW